MYMIVLSSGGLVHTCEWRVSHLASSCGWAPWEVSVAMQHMAVGRTGGPGASGKQAAPMWMNWGASTQLGSSKLRNSPSKVKKRFYFCNFWSIGRSGCGNWLAWALKLVEMAGQGHNSTSCKQMPRACKDCNKPWKTHTIYIRYPDKYLFAKFTSQHASACVLKHAQKKTKKAELMPVI